MQPPRGEGEAPGRLDGPLDRCGHRAAAARPRAVLAVCVVSALALHLLLLGRLPPARPAPVSAPPVALRLLGASPAPARSPGPSASEDRPAATPEPVVTRLEAPADPAVPVVSGAQLAGLARLDYVPRELLSRPPRPVSDIGIPSPDTGSVEFDLSVELTLFIDETGAVQRVRIEDPGLAPTLEQAAAAVFQAARFTPGEMDGVAVRSMVRVAVRFEAARVAPLPALLPAPRLAPPPTPTPPPKP